MVLCGNGESVVQDYGEAVKESDKLSVLHRTHRCDLSLFQIGLLWMEHCLNEDLPLPFLLAPRLRRNS